MTIYEEKGLMYSGAGVLIIEDYYKKNGTKIPCILLARNKASQKFMDFGGSYEKKDNSLKETAHNELREESRNLFNIDQKYFVNYVDIPAGQYYYRVYLLKINGTSRKYYDHNKRLLDNNTKIYIPRMWRETDMIAHIPLKNIDFNKLNIRGTIILKDINDNPVILHGRTKAAIYYARNKIEKIIKSHPIATRKDLIIHKSKKFTNGTYSFHL